MVAVAYDFYFYTEAIVPKHHRMVDALIGVVIDLTVITPTTVVVLSGRTSLGGFTVVGSSTIITICTIVAVNAMV